MSQQLSPAALGNGAVTSLFQAGGSEGAVPEPARYCCMPTHAL